MDVESYKNIVKKFTKEPPVEKTVWAKKGKLCIMFAEFRDLDIIKYNLWNLANVYGGTDASLFIVHSGENAQTIMDVVKDWKNVKCKEMFKHNIDVNEYSKLFVSHKFWNLFSDYEYVLTNQWDSYVFKPVPEKFFTYEYVGSPDGHYYIPINGSIMNICADTLCDCSRCMLGDHFFKASNFEKYPIKFYHLNGGYSLRKVSSMKYFCETRTYQGQPEDLFFTISKLSRPSREEACEFGINHLNHFTHPSPSGCHQVWARGEEYVMSLFSKI